MNVLHLGTWGPRRPFLQRDGSNQIVGNNELDDGSLKVDCSVDVPQQAGCRWLPAQSFSIFRFLLFFHFSFHQPNIFFSTYTSFSWTIDATRDAVDLFVCFGTLQLKEIPKVSTTTYLRRSLSCSFSCRTSRTGAAHRTLWPTDYTYFARYYKSYLTFLKAHD